MKVVGVFLCSALAFTSTAKADTSTFKVAQGSTVKFSIPYTFGTHHGSSSTVTGTIKMDPEMLEFVSATIRVPIASLKTGDEEKDCHMRESLGLDYAKSKFPEKHVCDDDHNLPEVGPNSIAHPDITFTSQGPVRLSLGKNELKGVWTIHGVSRTSNVSLKLSRSKDGQIIIDGSQAFSLRDFGIVVKPFMVVKVEDRVVAKFRILYVK